MVDTKGSKDITGQVSADTIRPIPRGTPPAASQGALYFDSSTNKLKISYDGLIWQDSGSSSAARGVLDSVMPSTTATCANSYYGAISRDSFRTCWSGYFNELNAGQTTAYHDNNFTPGYYQNDFSTDRTCYCCVCSVGGALGALTMGTTTFENHSSVCANGYACGYAGSGSSYCAQWNYCCALCNFTPEAYDWVSIKWCYWLCTRCASGGYIGYAQACLCTFGINCNPSISGGIPSLASGNAALDWKKVSGNIYDIYLNGTCICQVADIRTMALLNMVCGYANQCNQATSYACTFLAVVGRVSNCETCITTCGYAKTWNPANIYVGGTTGGSGAIVYKVTDASNSCILANNIPFNTSAQLCGNSCANCLIVQIKQCGGAQSKIYDWGYVLS